MITLNHIRAHDPCEGGWEKIVAATHLHGGDYDRPFPMASTLETNNLDDVLWALRCLPEHSRIWRKYAVWCARQVQHLMSDQRSIDALGVADRHANGMATDEDLAAARNATNTAAGAARAAWASAWASAWAAGAARDAWASADRKSVV